MTLPNAFDNDFTPRSILIVEDSESDLMTTSRQLKKVWPNSRILSAQTMGESYDLCRKNNFDLVLLDLNLPDSIGAATVSDFRKINLGARVVVLTGMDVDLVKKEAISYGASTVISKSKLLDNDFTKILMEHVFNIPSIAWK